jgi:ribosome maturation factor RimP
LKFEVSVISRTKYGICLVIKEKWIVSEIKENVEKLVLPILEQEHIELVDVEFVKEGSNWFLRIFIDKEDGIDIDDCSRVSEGLSARLDENDPIPQAYFLEVSSPGAERPLKKPQDLLKAIGKHVHITTYEPINGDKVFEGKLISFENDELTIQEAKKQKVVPYSKVASARLAIVF